MRRANCAQCGNSFALGELFSVAGQTLCQACAEQRLAQNPALRLQANAVTRQADPTVCARCGADQGEIELPRTIGLPMCQECEDRVRRYPFPLWVKFAAAAVIALAVVSLWHNERFLTGGWELARGQNAAKAGDFARAWRLMDDVAARVPEQAWLASVAAAYHGMWLMTEDRPAEALPFFRTAKAGAPADSGLETMILNAEGNAAFDAQDYDTFLDRQQAMHNRMPDQPIFVLGVASAHACKYAVTGDDAHRQKALDSIERARHMRGGDDPPQREYIMRIRHRLATREIIKQKEFAERYPNGWREEGQNP